MRVRAAAGSRNSSRRCASPREIRTPGRWRRNRLAHSSIASRRLPRSNAPRNRRKPHSRRRWRAPSVSINKEIELGVPGRWPPLSECTICSDPASRSSSCREVGCAALQTIRREYAAPPHGSCPRGAWGFCRSPDPSLEHPLGRISRAHSTSPRGFWRSMNASWRSRPEQEVQANIFASELLMPTVLAHP